MKKYAIKFIFLIIAPFIFVTGCDNNFSLFDHLSSPVKVVVYNADQKNFNKTNPKPAVELWAASTRYESGSRYSVEKVKLTDLGNGRWQGTLPLVDSNGVSVIVFDDVQTKPIPYGNVTPGTTITFYYNRVLPTNDYFSPCNAGIRSDGTLLYNLLSGKSMSVFATGLTVNNSGTVNDEVFAITYLYDNESVVEVNYKSMSKAPANWFCNCTRNIQFINITTGSPPGTIIGNNSAVKFTDQDNRTPYSNPYNYYSPVTTTTGVFGDTACPKR